MRLLAVAAVLAVLFALVPTADASRPLPAGATIDPDSPRACVWTDPGEDAGTTTCADPTNTECWVYTVYETIAGPLFICHVPAP